MQNCVTLAWCRISVVEKFQPKYANAFSTTFLPWQSFTVYFMVIFLLHSYLLAIKTKHQISNEGEERALGDGAQKGAFFNLNPQGTLRLIFSKTAFIVQATRNTSCKTVTSMWAKRDLQRSRSPLSRSTWHYHQYQIRSAVALSS